jgi:MurNAc alpha-1-phosphate uridylyltransferase
MKAMILAAGYGSRLGSITERTPKCLVSVGGKTMLEIVVERLISAGVSEIVINVHYLSEVVEQFISDKTNFGTTIHISRETSLLGTGGGLKKAWSFLAGDEPFFVHNADVFSKIDLREMYAYHQSSQAMVTLGVMERATSRPLLFSSSGLLCGYENRKQETGDIFGDEANLRPLAFSGVQVISPSFYPFLEEYEGEFSSISSFLKAAKAGERIQLFDVSNSFWVDIGTPEKLAEVRTALEGKHH